MSNFFRRTRSRTAKNSKYDGRSGHAIFCRSEGIRTFDHLLHSDTGGDLVVDGAARTMTGDAGGVGRAACGVGRAAWAVGLADLARVAAAYRRPTPAPEACPPA